MDRGSKGYILVPMLMFTTVIGLWTLHGLAEAEMNYAAAGRQHTAATQARALEDRLVAGERQLDLSETLTDPATTVTAIGCVDLSGRWQTTCASGTTHLFAYRIIVSAADNAHPLAIEALYLSHSPPGQLLTALPEVPSPDRQNFYTEKLELFTDGSVLPSPGRLAFRQVSVW